jgi:fluoride ion exporter CrcB/FEX
MATAPSLPAPLSTNQASALPTRKVTAGGLAGAVATIAVFALNTYVLPHDKPLTAEISVALATVFSFAISYFIPPAATDRVITG